MSVIWAGPYAVDAVAVIGSLYAGIRGRKGKTRVIFTMLGDEMTHVVWAQFERSYLQ